MLWPIDLAGAIGGLTGYLSVLERDAVTSKINAILLAMKNVGMMKSG